MGPKDCSRLESHFGPMGPIGMPSVTRGPFRPKVFCPKLKPVTPDGGPFYRLTSLWHPFVMFPHGSQHEMSANLQGRAKEIDIEKDR